MKARLSEGYQPDFDIDVRRGRKGERLVAAFLEGFTDGTIEVKNDSRWIDTQRVYIEYQCRRSDGWQDSGIRTSKASYWALVIGEAVVLGIPTELLRFCVERAQDPKLRMLREEKDGSHPTRGVAIPTQYLLTLLLVGMKREQKAAA